MRLIIHTDGGSRGNPGEAAVGVVIEQTVNGKQQTVIEIGKRIGIKTNNEAEYLAVITALEELIKRKLLDAGGIEFVLDSLLIVNQIKGLYKVKQAHLRELLLQVHSLQKELSVSIHFRHVLRTENREADRLVNEALDKA